MAVSRARRSTKSTMAGSSITGVVSGWQIIVVTPPAAAVKTYTVVSGDTLSKIAQKFYGKAGEYMKIFEANKNQLSDPDKIQVGQELVIPD